jgi:hypothetical protein
MDTKFSSHYWSHPEVEAASPEIKLAGAWMRTNDRVTLFGYAQVTPERFAFETGLPKEGLARAIQALPDWFTPLPKGYFVPGFIREQIGCGEALLSNNVCKGLVRALVALNDPEVFALVMQHYPELQVALKVTDFSKPLVSPCQGVREEKRGEEKSSVEKRGGDRGVGKEDPAPVTPTGRSRRSKPGSTLPSELPEPFTSRMIEVGALKGRQPTTPWTVKELEAFKEARLHSCSAEDFAGQLAPMKTYYAAKIPREIGDFRRRELLTLLNNWPGELDKARAWARDHDDGYRKVS